MSYKRVFIDGNVILDYFIKNRPFSDFSEKSIDFDATEIFYIIPFSNLETKKAINLMQKKPKFKDLEDTLQYVLAKESSCDLILSNDNDFFSPDIKVMSTKEFVESIVMKKII